MRDLILKTIRTYIGKNADISKSAEHTIEALLRLTLDHEGYDGRAADPQVEICKDGVFCSYLNKAGRLIIVQA